MRAVNTLEALSRFLGSYCTHAAGSPHHLIFLLKGFGKELPPAVAAILNRVSHSKIYCPDSGYDIGSYYYATERIRESLVFFANSFSILQGDQWLSKFLYAYHEAGVGLVGATGSWESLSSDFLNSRPMGSDYSIQTLLTNVKALTIGTPLLALFPAFPNIHVRTNGFLLDRKDFIALRPRRMRTKLEARLFESGRNSMTRRMLNLGRRVVVVGRNGSVYQPEEWPRSMTFWQSNQENLLVQDNRTIAYANDDAEMQALKFRFAWACRRV